MGHGRAHGRRQAPRFADPTRLCCQDKATGRKELRFHLQVRDKCVAKGSGESYSEALSLNRRGGRLSARSVCEVVVQLGASVGLEISTHVLRHTFGTNLVKQGTDMVLVAEMMGLSRLETTRRYSLPSAGDRVWAIDRLPVEG
ncbi:MAG: tyrosine-type recombinase/integrase [Ferrimicrobium sp.]